MIKSLLHSLFQRITVDEVGRLLSALLSVMSTQTCQHVDARWSVSFLLQEGVGVASAKASWSRQFFAGKLQTDLELVHRI